MANKIQSILAIIVAVVNVIVESKPGEFLECRRLSDVQIIGFDVNGHVVKLDVGRCSTKYEPSDIKPNSDYQSVLKRILNKKRDKEFTQCASTENNADDNSECVASVIRVETVTITQGPQFYDVIESCACRKISKSCERLPKLKKFFAGTKFEAVVDVGQCEGGCRNFKHQKICRETRTTIHSVAGPNGALSVHGVAQCNCERACYRQHFNIAVTELAVAPNGNSVERTKLIDVGKCVGSCGPIKRCVVRDNSVGGKNRNCLMSLETSDVSCVPTRIHDVTYTDSKNEETHVTQIRKCGCT